MSGGVGVGWDPPVRRKSGSKDPSLEAAGLPPAPFGGQVGAPRLQFWCQFWLPDFKHRFWSHFCEILGTPRSQKVEFSLEGLSKSAFQQIQI